MLLSALLVLASPPSEAAAPQVYDMAEAGVTVKLPRGWESTRWSDWDFKGKALQAGDFSQHFSVDLMHKDLTLAMATGQALGVPMPGTAAIREVYQLARRQGLGQEDICATAKVVDPGLGGAK